MPKYKVANRNKYRPTPAQAKLLDVLLDPTNRHLNKQELCKKAGVGRPVYYRAFNNPDFVAYYHKLSTNLIGEAVAPILQAAIREAKCGSYNHAKLLLEMVSLHQDSLAITGKDGGAIITADMPAKEAAALYAKKIKGEG